MHSDSDATESTPCVEGFRLLTGCAALLGEQPALGSSEARVRCDFNLAGRPSPCAWDTAVGSKDAAGFGA